MMLNKRLLLQSITAILVGGLATHHALAQVPLSVPEVEANDSVTTAQHLDIPETGVLSVNGSVGDPTGLNPVPDVDFYSFDALAGSDVTLDIDNAYKGRISGSTDLMMALYGPAPDYELKLIAISGPADPGSLNTLDPYMGPMLLDKDGTYFIAITSEAPSKQFLSGGIVANANTLRTSLANGTYTLTVSGVKVPPPVQIIGLSIKPESQERAAFNPKAQGVVPVALLSSPKFDPMQVDTDKVALTFGSDGTEQSLRSCQKYGKDVNGDGLPDLICMFDVGVAHFKPQDTIGTAIGQMKNGKRFMGHGDLKVIPKSVEDEE